jgi:aspartate aminotransferase-like enzyme
MSMKQYLLTPGPTPVPDRVLLAMARPVLHHRMPAFSKIFNEVVDGLSWIYQTAGKPIILNGSGTVAMEAAVVNLMSKGDLALVAHSGKFGERWVELCKAYGVGVVEVKAPYGAAVDPAAVEKALADNPGVRAVFIQANESSTGVRQPYEAVAKLAHAQKDCLVVVDAVSALGAWDIKMDELGIDALITGSQKALMLPPGLAFIALSERAWARQPRSDLPKYYLNLATERKAQQNGETAWTPGVSLIIGLAEALAMLKEEGLAAIFARHDALARATRAAAVAAGLELYAPGAPSPTVTAIKAPRLADGTALDTDLLVKHLRSSYGVSIVGGQGSMKGQIFRVAHLGYYGPFDILTVVTALEMSLKDLGCKVELGVGTRAAEEILSAWRKQAKADAAPKK